MVGISIRVPWLYTIQGGFQILPGGGGQGPAGPEPELGVALAEEHFQARDATPPGLPRFAQKAGFQRVVDDVVGQARAAVPTVGVSGRRVCRGCDMAGRGQAEIIGLSSSYLPRMPRGVALMIS